MRPSSASCSAAVSQRTTDPGTRREPASIHRHAADRSTSLNRDEALELLGQLEAALVELRKLRAQGEAR
jgi:hypothetical protein